ncbi:amidohydrolase [Echinicola marina]|uniref:amidohydrolase n=1 Tax=Echinicola marina TaxID=2859768 RepID=UPI001CF6C25B|nr:amidohydrolase [Echinicola marina]UCS94872.1 amidohydrolase [Echinicola marina]
MKKADFQKLVNFRKELHQHPELSGKEKSTAKSVKDFFSSLNPDECIEELGGHGLAFIFKGKEDGPSTLIRCELDALPIQESLHIKHKSKVPNCAHSCGHDGHMAIVAGLGMSIAAQKPKKGQINLLFQPAEETGDGAKKVLQDPKYHKIKSDFSFALHNLPGEPENEIILKKGVFTAASKGMIIELQGRTSHAAHPEDGISPAQAMSKIIVGLPLITKSIDSFSLVTVIHAELGEISFGTSPGKASIRATLRTIDDQNMGRLLDYAEQLCSLIAKEYQLELSISYTEEFACTINDDLAWNYANEAAKKLELKTKHIRSPFKWSEDFGQFSSESKTLLFGLGSGKNQPRLHEAHYDFPDKIIPTGINMFEKILEQIHH